MGEEGAISSGRMDTTLCSGHGCTLSTPFGLPRKWAGQTRPLVSHRGPETTWLGLSQPGI